MDEPEGPEEFFVGHPAALAVFDRVRSILDEVGPHQVRTSKSQVGFRRGRGFAFLWLPDRYLHGDVAEVVLSIALDRPIVSDRFKEVVQPAPGRWMHHLEVRHPGEIDDEVATWLRDAADRAGPQITSK
ncbi:MAG TPA: DUF5655 domain-containing protein [Actinomycetota bacterium]|nr:DUF5655 domain-containing protein [Actinomycetota bacterium]